MTQMPVMLTELIDKVANTLIPCLMDTRRAKEAAVQALYAAGVPELMEESRQLREIVGLFEGANASFEHGDDVQCMLKFGEAHDRLKAFREAAAQTGTRPA